MDNKVKSTEIDVRLLELLVCPLTKGPLEYDAARSELVSHKARLAYPVRGGIPIMLPSEARTIDANEGKNS
ncbi:Trm112 family protein [Brucella sp. BE17]|uniref:Trm112 family protein n=1 Tax=Brucella sp. BE17 TaxID=3142977 RepID=UPI0031BAC544